MDSVVMAPSAHGKWRRESQGRGLGTYPDCSLSSGLVGLRAPVDRATCQVLGERQREHPRESSVRGEDPALSLRVPPEDGEGVASAHTPCTQGAPCLGRESSPGPEEPSHLKDRLSMASRPPALMAETGRQTSLRKRRVGHLKRRD